MKMTVKMLSKVAFASLAFACVDAAYAADIDTTPGVTLSAENKYIGAGTLTVSGGGDVWLGGGGGSPITEFAMTGGLIDIVSGTTLKNGGWQKGVWTDNKAGMQVNGTLDVFDGNNIFADALTGSGTVTMGDISWSTLNKSITVGVNGGGGTFTGTISDSGDDTIGIIKEGGGTQILTGPNTYRGATTINGGTLKLQGAAFYTTARAYSIASGAVLNLDGGTGVAWGNTTISGTGTLRISGGWQGSGDDGRDLTLALGSGAVIEIQPGATLYNGGWQNMTWTDNKASLQVDGTLEMTNGNWIFADALTGSGAVTMDVSWAQWDNSIIVGVNGGGGTFTGTISDSGDDTLSLIKTGGGTQILTGANTYRGATTINGGTLRIVGNSSGAGALTVASGARLGGTGSYGGSITMLAGAGLNCELSVTDSTLTCAGQLSFNNLDFESCAFTGAVGAGYPPYRRIPLIEAASLGTTTFANGASSTEGTIAGVPAKLYLKGNILMLDVGYTPGTRISFF
jgi:fibronectin-binding autotransporter adhesin